MLSFVALLLDEKAIFRKFFEQIHKADEVQNSILKKILIITEKYGALGNRLFRFARIFALAQREKYCLLDLTFFQYSYLYAPKNFFAAIFFIALQLLNNQRLKKIEKQLSLSSRVHSWNFMPEQEEGWCVTTSQLNKIIDATLMRVVLFTKGSFFFRCDEIEEQIKEKLRRIFRLKSRYLITAKALLKKAGCLSQKNTIVVVHIRQGDYKLFAGGVHYFEEAVYASCMKHLWATFQETNLTFILLTQEMIDLKPFEGLPFCFFGKQSIGVDQALLQFADYILSPNSTFSAWPSFLYNIPQGIMRSEALPLNWSDFKITGLNFNEQ